MTAPLKPGLCKRCARTQVLPHSHELNRWSVFVTGQAPDNVAREAGRRVIEQWDLLDHVLEICDECAADPRTVLWALLYVAGVERETKRCAKCCGALIPNTNTCPICDVV